MEIRLSGVASDSIVDGVGLRFTVFTQGCPHHCPDCHNPQTHSFTDGYTQEVEGLFPLMEENPLLDGLTLSGGEPFVQPEACLILAKKAHTLGLNVWAYTGYTWEELFAENEPSRMQLLREVDVLVDGRFIAEEKTLGILFRGSRNQRLIDVQKSLETNAVVLWEKEEFVFE